MIARHTRPGRATAPQAGHAPPVTVAPVPGHVFGGYDVWAALHREAADAAERWLAAILGESSRVAFAGAAPGPDSSIASLRNVENRTLDRLRVAAVRAVHAPLPVPRPSGPIPIASPPRSAAGRNAESRALDRLREVAVRAALDVERRQADADPLPVRRRALPTRRRSEPPSSGDMNAVMVSIARANDPYQDEVSEPPDSHTRAHTTSGARKSK